MSKSAGPRRHLGPVGAGECDGYIRNDDIYWPFNGPCLIWFFSIERGLVMELYVLL